MRSMVIVVVCFAFAATASADGMAEVNEWRRRCGLPPFLEDPTLTEFALAKARYRAERNLRDGHRGPKPAATWHEGTGEASPSWGWLTCEMESDFKYAGAGVCVGSDGTRYMVLVCREGSGRALLARQNAPVHNTSYLTPNPPRVGSLATMAAKPCPHAVLGARASFRDQANRNFMKRRFGRDAALINPRRSRLRMNLLHLAEAGWQQALLKGRALGGALRSRTR